MALEKDRLVGYSDWSVTDGEAWITDYTSTRLGVGAAVGNKAAQILLELGHRQIKALVNSTNEASLLVLQKLGCKVAGELAHTFVRKL